VKNIEEAKARKTEIQKEMVGMFKSVGYHVRIFLGGLPSKLKKQNLI